MFKHIKLQALNPTSPVPLLLSCRTVFDDGERPMEFAEVHYVSSRFTLTPELRPGGDRA